MRLGATLSAHFFNAAILTWEPIVDPCGVRIAAGFVGRHLLPLGLGRPQSTAVAAAAAAAAPPAGHVIPRALCIDVSTSTPLGLTVSTDMLVAAPAAYAALQVRVWRGRVV